MNNVLHPGALNANRKGRLSLLQVIEQVPWLFLGAFIFLIGAGMLGYFVYKVIYSLITHTPIYSSPYTSDISDIILTVGVNAIFDIGFGAGMMWIGYLAGGKLLLDLLIGPVQQIEGPGMKYSAVGSTRGSTLYYSVGGLDFQIPWFGTYNALHDANMVRAYYLPRSKTLVNVEICSQ